jgi:hypothetical protein
MNAFLIELDNKVGELARVAEALAAKGINITGVSGSTCGDGGSVALLAADEAGAQAALEGIGCSFRAAEATDTTMRHEPGALAKAARRLADGGVNIEAVMITGMRGDDVVVTFVTGDPAKARSLLAQAGSAAG